MWALVDCNSFFCSVEQAFHPGLQGKPVCVLSSNDGCIVALTPEAKALGLRRGDPLFKVRDIVDAHHVAVFSGNMQLYAAMSKRIKHILRESVLRVESYSIDECFCHLDGYDHAGGLEEYMRSVAEKIRLYTDVPVSVGIAPSKTLAKMGSKFAKQYKGYRGVCMIDTDEKRLKALSLFSLADVWGIGRHTLAKLERRGINTPLDLAMKSRSWVKANLQKPGMQTWMELNGWPCIDTAEVQRNKTICYSRSFGEMVTDMQSLKAAVASFASSCANKLRAQQAVAQTVTVFIGSNRFREDLAQYANTAQRALLTPTSDTLQIVRAAMELLHELYKPGICYKRAGVILMDISDASVVQQDLFNPIKNVADRACLMHVIDSLNARYGTKTVQLSVEGDSQQGWRTKSEYRSQNYLTNINELLTIRI